MDSQGNQAGVEREGAVAGALMKPHKGAAMPLSRIVVSAFGLGAALLVAAWDAGTGAHAQAPAANAKRAVVANPITGEGLPNPAPVVTRNWGQLPAGRKWGTSAGIDIDPKDGNIWAYERCGAGTAGGGPVDCDNTPLDPIFKFDRHTGAVLANIGKGVMVTPHGIYVADGHDAQGMTTNQAIAEGLKRGATSRISKFTADGKFIKSWGTIGVKHGEFRTPHALMFDARGRLWVADRGNHRIEIFDQDGNYLESRYQFSRVSGFFIKGDTLYAIDSESSPTSHPNWRDGVRIGPMDEDRVVAFI